MIRQSSPLRRSPIRYCSKKKARGVPGGEYIFDLNSKHYELPGRFVQDETSLSDDRRRWIATPESNRVIRELVCKVADKQCQVRRGKGCWKWAPLHLGHPHHGIHKKLGGAFTDDRIWIVIDGEISQIRVWSCPTCHQEHHNKLYWTPKEQAA